MRVDINIFDMSTALLGDLDGVSNMVGNAITASTVDVNSFGVYVLDGATEDMQNKLTVMANAFKGTYKSVTDTLDTVHAFDNSYWAASARGVCNISHFTDDAVTNEFFSSTFVSNTKQHYFVLYLLALNRYYTLCKRLGQMSAMNTKRDIESEEDISKAKEFMLELSRKNDLFDLRCCFDVASSINHINDVYDMYNKALNIGGLTKQCQASSKALKGLEKYYSDKHEQACEEKQMRSSIFVFIIAQILGAFSLYKSIADILSDTFNISIYDQRIWIIVPLTIVGIFCVAMTLQIISKVRAYRHIRTIRGRK